MMTWRARGPMLGAALLLAAFVAGVATGVAGARLASKPAVRTRVIGDMSPVLDELQLSPDQRRRADAILQRRAPRAEGVMLEVAEELRAISDSLDAELRAILTPAQRVRLDSLRRKSRIMVKRKVVGPGGTTTVDTLISTPRR